MFIDSLVFTASHALNVINATNKNVNLSSVIAHIMWCILPWTICFHCTEFRYNLTFSSSIQNDSLRAYFCRYVSSCYRVLCVLCGWHVCRRQSSSSGVPDAPLEEAKRANKLKTNGLEILGNYDRYTLLSKGMHQTV